MAGFISDAASNISIRYKEVITEAFDDQDYFPIKPSHFIPWNKFDGTTDLSNGDHYHNEDPKTTRLKCLAVFAATPIVHAIGLLLNLANKIAKFISFAYFWHPSEEPYSLSKRTLKLLKDILIIAFTPLIFVGLQLASLYGTILPNHGRKMYATFERCAYGRDLIAPCFQPDPTHHLGGADMSESDGW